MLGEIVISAPEPKMYEVDSEGDFSNCGAERAIRHSRGILTGPEWSRQPSARETEEDCGVRCAQGGFFVEE